ncbi:MAG: RNA polymerase factor sigma-32 [Thermodesulfobacteriota bacterium]
MSYEGSKAEEELVTELAPEDASAEDVLRIELAPPSEAPAVFDPLRRYLYEISKYELLDREEEKALAVKYKTEGDEDAAYRLITSNLRLVVKIAMEFQNNWMKNLLDLIQEGNIGLMQALKKFDPYRGVKFSYYASYWIKAYILKFIMDNFHLVRVGTTQAQRKLFFNLKKERERLLAEGVEPGPRLLAERLQVSERDVVEMGQRLEGREVSLDAPIKTDAGDTHLDFLASGQEPVDDRLADSQVTELLKSKLMEFRRTLSPRDAEVLDRRILAEEPETLQDMGDRFGISRERVRQIEERIKKKIRTYLKAELPDLDDADYLSGLGQEG